MSQQSPGCAPTSFLILKFSVFGCVLHIFSRIGRNIMYQTYMSLQI